MSWKDLFVVQEPGAPAAQPPKPATPAGVAPPPARLRVTADDVALTQPMPIGGVYDRLFQKINFGSTAAGMEISKYENPLRDVLTDEKARVRSAVKLAAQDGVDKNKIVGTFDDLQKQLQDEVQKFNGTVSVHVQEEINTKKAKISDLSSQVGLLQAQITQLSGEVSDAQTQVEKVRGEFNNAVFRRQTELENERKHYTDLLG